MKPTRYHILLSLAGGPLHGAAIRRAVSAQSLGTVVLYPAMLYGTLESLSALGWIEEAVGPSESAEQSRWRFYGLTAEGRLAVEEETRRLESVVAHARNSLGQV